MQPFAVFPVYRLGMSINRIFRPASFAAPLLLLAACGTSLFAQKTSAPARSPAGQPSAAAPSAPDAQPTSTISVDARLVNIPVVVHDKKGALVQNLTKDNFLLYVDKQPQTIRYFNIDTDLPLTLGLLVDTSMSQREVLDDERTASSAFIDDMLTGPEGRDKAFIIQFSRQAEDVYKRQVSAWPRRKSGIGCARPPSPHRSQRLRAPTDCPRPRQSRDRRIHPRSRSG